MKKVRRENFKLRSSPLETKFLIGIREYPKIFHSSFIGDSQRVRKKSCNFRMSESQEGTETLFSSKIFFSFFSFAKGYLSMGRGSSG